MDHHHNQNRTKAMTEPIVKTSASIIITIIAAALVAVYLSACSSFNAEAVVNPLTGSAKISIHASK